MLRIAGEVAVGGEDAPFSAAGHGAHEEVDGTAGNPLAPAQVVHLRRALVIRGLQRYIGEWPQMLAQPGELRWVPDTGKQLLAYDSQELGLSFPNQLL